MTAVIVSMTTIPARNGTVGKTIASLHRQSVKPDEIRLYLTPGCKPCAGVKCIETADYGPVTKLMAITDPDLAPDTIIVTCDDDIVYDRDWLKKLVIAARATPDDAIGYKGWNVADFLAHPDTGTFQSVTMGNPCDVIEGYAGAAYRKRFFVDKHGRWHPDFFDPPERYRWVDDVWISGGLMSRKITRRLIGPKACKAQKIHPGISDRPDFIELNRRAVQGWTY